MTEPKIICKYDELIAVKNLSPYKKNRNQHSPEQITRLAFLLREHGVRAPIIVATAPFNCIAKGHGTVMAIKENGWEYAPVVYQDFESEEALYTFCQSDNAIQTWAELDLPGIHVDIQELGPFDLDLLGIKDFELSPIETEEKLEPEKKTITCPACGETFGG